MKKIEGFSTTIKAPGIIRLKEGDPPPFQFGLNEGDVIVCEKCGKVLAYPHDGIRLHPDLIVWCGCFPEKNLASEDDLT